MRRVLIFPLIIFSCFLLMRSATAEQRTRTSDLPDVEEILNRAIEADKEVQKLRLESVFTYKLSTRSESLDKEGLPKKVETRLYENILLPGGSFERLIEKDGRPLTEKEARKEAKREKKYREKLAKGEKSENEEAEIAFDEELISRYDFALQGLEDIDGRSTYVIAFQPRPGKLPARRKIDRALNKFHGTIWIDQISYRIPRLEFELIEPISIWWGILGSISKMSGELHFREIDEDIWFPSTFHFYIKGRMLFRSLHQKQQVHWSNFEKAASAEESSSG